MVDSFMMWAMQEESFKETLQYAGPIHVVKQINTAYYIEILNHKSFMMLGNHNFSGYTRH